MRILTKCPKCREPIPLLISDADKRKRCTRCGRLFKVPDMDQLKEALDSLSQANTIVYVDENGNFYG